MYWIRTTRLLVGYLKYFDFTETLVHSHTFSSLFKKIIRKGACPHSDLPNCRNNGRLRAFRSADDHFRNFLHHHPSIFSQHSIYTMQLAQRGELITHHKDQAVLTLMNLEQEIETDLRTCNSRAHASRFGGNSCHV